MSMEVDTQMTHVGTSLQQLCLWTCPPLPLVLQVVPGLPTSLPPSAASLRTGVSLSWMRLGQHPQCDGRICGPYFHDLKLL